MADTKLSALTELAVEPADTDEIYVNDGGTSKRITYGTLKTALLARANHTGTQTASTISDFASAVAATASVTANTAKISADDPALISALAEVTAEGTDYAVILDTSVSPNALKKILISDLLDNATHTGDVTGSDALTAQPAIITGKGAVTVAGGDLLLVADISASPQVLGQVTASSVASLATPEGTAILSTGEVGGSKFLREDGDGTCSWQTVPAGTGDLKADGTVPLTANWDVGSFDITAEQFHSDIATGTAPFTVASTTVVTNLNADQVDGNEASALLARANHTGTQTASTISDFDTEVANNSAVSANTAKVTNATHTGDATGDTALTLQPAAITGKGAVTVDGADLLLVTDVSASPQVLGQVTAQSIANLAPAVQGSAILSSDTSPLVTDGYVLTADGAGGAAWEAASGGGWANMSEAVWTGGTQSEVADGASAVAFNFSTDAAYSTSGAKLTRWQNNGTEKAYIDKDGLLGLTRPGNETQIGTIQYGPSGTAGFKYNTHHASYGHEFNVNGTPYWRVGSIDTTKNSLTLTTVSFKSTSAAEVTISVQGSDAATNALTISGQNALPAASTNLDGGGILVIGGAGASGSAGDADGGNVTIRGGTAYGTGSTGLIIMDNLPTSDPGVAGALWSNSNVLTVSTG